MNERLTKLRDFTHERGFKKYRSPWWLTPQNVTFGGGEALRNAALFKLRCQTENVKVLPGEKIVFMRTLESLVNTSPRDWFCDSVVIRVDGSVDKKATISRMFRNGMHKASRSINERLDWLFLRKKPRVIIRDSIHNVCPNYELLMRDGLVGRRELARRELDKVSSGSEREFLDGVIQSVDALCGLMMRYADACLANGDSEMSDMLVRLTKQPPQTFHEALQLLRFVSSALYLADAYQCGFGRMDQYLYPFYHDDIENGRISREKASDLLTEFFISLNRDSDLYRGVQQGDNGQSVMLGGCDPDTGESCINDLTYLILEVSKDVRMIDPKINLRIDRNTPVDLLDLGSELTRCGLGFPQYSNDEVVIPALVKAGYSLRDARNYTVAACWEFIIPGRGMDVVNQGAVSFPYAVHNAIGQCVKVGKFSLERMTSSVRTSIHAQIENILSQRDVRMTPSPFVSAFFDDAIAAHRDATESAPYRNIGIHGSGSANAADAWAAAEALYQEGGMESLKSAYTAASEDFRGNEGILQKLRNAMPKVGCLSDAADEKLTTMFSLFAEEAKKFKLETGALRAGTGSAMYYVWLTDTKTPRPWLIEPTVGATLEGRRLDAPLGASLAPSHESKVNGVMSVFKSFSKIDYEAVVNGGPVTIELSHTVFDASDGIRKLSQLVQYFVTLGCQQLQLNVLNVAELEDAMSHPERHRNLIVRVWGWSGYFCELAPEYQRQIIKRHRYAL